jgi:hypothetical protein
MRGRAHLKERLASFAAAAAVKRPSTAVQPMEMFSMDARGAK